MSTVDRFRGCLMGLALGDALGAPFEGTAFGCEDRLERFFRTLPEVLHYTDDTEMAIGVAESLTQRPDFDPGHMARQFAANCHTYRGYGAGAMAVLELIGQGMPWHEANRRVFPEGSFGNGAAMRAAPIGLACADDPARLREVTLTASAITHAHPIGQEGALLITTATACALKGLEPDETLMALEEAVTLDIYKEKLGTVRKLLKVNPSQPDVIRELGHGVAAHESAPTAVYIYLRYGHDYSRAIGYAIALGGDTDTIAAMTGAVTGARHGEETLPGEALARLEDRERIGRLAQELFDEFKS